MDETLPIQNQFNELHCCVIIPTYNNASTIVAVISSVLTFTSNVIVVNDGSNDGTFEILQSVRGIALVSYDKNKGKGYALQQGFAFAYQHGYSHAITIDADGQHYPSDLHLFLEALSENPDALFTGVRTLKGTHIPANSSFANKFSNFWFQFITNQTLPDTQCGYRLYPLKVLNEIHFYSTKYEFELEVMVRAAWKQTEIIPIPVNVFYPKPEERVTHFRPFTDFFRISVLNTLFVFIVILYIKPLFFFKRLTFVNIKQFLDSNILKTKDSNKIIVFSVMLGIFMGIVPIWGYQLVAAIALAHLLKLNKFIVIVAANVSIVPMVPVIIFLSFLTGGYVLGIPMASFYEHPFAIEQMKAQIVQYLIGSMVFAIIASLFCAGVTYLALKWFRMKTI